MSKQILILVGHPDPSPERLCRALAKRYQEGAESFGHQTTVIDLAELEFPLLRRGEDWQHGELPEVLRPVQEAIRAADHLVIIYPLWLGEMPALLKGLLEQVLRPGFAVGDYGQPGGNRRLLSGKSARIIITMGMPGLVYRWYFAAHSLKSLKRNILAFCGIAPVRSTFFGMAGSSTVRRENWLRKVFHLGQVGK